jgi:ABC-type phosphate transport system substrate-binding protein
VVCHSSTHGTFDTFCQHLGLLGEVQPDRTLRLRQPGTSDAAGIRLLLADGSTEAIELVSGDDNAIGFATMAFAQRIASKGGAIRLLDLDGIEPTIASVVIGRYPIRRSLNLVTMDAPAGCSLKFVELMTSAAGQNIIERLDFIRLPAAGPSPR